MAARIEHANRMVEEVDEAQLRLKRGFPCVGLVAWLRGRGG